jgi:uncharacterized membrane protein
MGITDLIITSDGKSMRIKNTLPNHKNNSKNYKDDYQKRKKISARHYIYCMQISLPEVNSFDSIASLLFQLLFKIIALFPDPSSQHFA